MLHGANLGKGSQEDIIHLAFPYINIAVMAMLSQLTIKSINIKYYYKTHFIIL